MGNYDQKLHICIHEFWSDQTQWTTVYVGNDSCPITASLDIEEKVERKDAFFYLIIPS